MARYFQWLPEAQVQALVRQLVQAAREAEACQGFNRLWLANELELDTVWMGSTLPRTSISPWTGCCCGTRRGR
ncbi:MAG: hypothetical protein HS113_01525 [Verrucomicrobiales bacterium]|nr:hypothetical protein [Verrucomicrobiales bacterium]